VKKKCVTCDKKFIVRKRYTQRYCDKACRPKYTLNHYYKTRKLAPKTEKKCGFCGDSFYEDKRRKYCDNECSKGAANAKRGDYDSKYAPQKKTGVARARRNAWRQSAKGKRKISEAASKRNKLPKYKVASSVRNTIHSAIKRRGISKREWNKTKNTFDLLGYTPIELVKHIESQFTGGMTWDNHSMKVWHLDHIRPVASFNFDSAEHPDFKKCWALNNLQPLWAQDNIRKGNKWDGIINR
jgi:hypothetical protein